MIYSVFLGHDDFASSSIKAAELVIGKQTDYSILSNSLKSLDDIEKELVSLVDKHIEGQLFLFVDFYGSSFSTPVLRIRNNFPDRIFVIFGYNLPVVIDFFVHKKTKEGRTLVEKLLSIGKGAVRE